MGVALTSVKEKKRALFVISSRSLNYTPNFSPSVCKAKHHMHVWVPPLPSLKSYFARIILILFLEQSLVTIVRTYTWVSREPTLEEVTVMFTPLPSRLALRKRKIKDSHLRKQMSVKSVWMGMDGASMRLFSGAYCLGDVFKRRPP